MNYEELLKKAKEALPKNIETTERFEIPTVKGHVQGNKTIIMNFNQICSTLRREPKLILKYLQRELATPAQIDGPRLILGRKLSSSLINEKIERFTNEFVICKLCKKPDTKLIKENKVLSIKCLACGAKYPITSKI